jgi:hypothetical protein
MALFLLTSALMATRLLTFMALFYNKQMNAQCNMFHPLTHPLMPPTEDYPLRKL